MVRRRRVACLILESDNLDAALGERYDLASVLVPQAITGPDGHEDMGNDMGQGRPFETEQVVPELGEHPLEFAVVAPLGSDIRRKNRLTFGV
jgi:hypothetical protein